MSLKFGRKGIEVPPTDTLELELTPEQLEAKRYSVDLREQLLQYQEEWSQKIIESGLPTSNEHVLPFAQARGSAMHLAEAYAAAANDQERDSIMLELTTKLEELKGPLTMNLEGAIKGYEDAKEKTPAEHKQDMAAAIGGIEDVTHKEKLETPEAKTSGPISEEQRAKQRELKAQQFAEKFGIEAQRTVMLEAEAEYAKAIKEYNAKGIKIPFRENASTKEQQDKFDEALLNWQNALSEAGSRATPSERVAARFIGERDIATRMARVRNEAALAGLDEKGKSTFGKVQNWIREDLKRSTRDAIQTAQGYSNITEKVGGKFVKGALAGGKLVGIEVDEIKHAEKIKRASRIFGSAVLMSAIAAPAGALSAGVVGWSFLMRTVRGSIGAGTSALLQPVLNKLSDKDLERVVTENKQAQEVLLKDLRDRSSGAFGAATMEDIKFVREQHRKGSKEGQAARLEKNEKERTLLQAAASILQAEATFGLSHFPAVHHAAETLQSEYSLPKDWSVEHSSHIEAPISHNGEVPINHQIGVRTSAEIPPSHAAHPTESLKSVPKPEAPTSKPETTTAPTPKLTVEFVAKSVQTPDASLVAPVTQPPVAEAPISPLPTSVAPETVAAPAPTESLEAPPTSAVLDQSSAAPAPGLQEQFVPKQMTADFQQQTQDVYSSPSSVDQFPQASPTAESITPNNTSTVETSVPSSNAAVEQGTPAIETAVPTQEPTLDQSALTQQIYPNNVPSTGVTPESISDIGTPHAQLPHVDASPVEHAPAAAVHAPVSGQPEILFNGPKEIVVGGQQLDLRTPHLVESKVNHGALVLVGGTHQERWNFAQAHLNKNPDAELYSASDEINPVTKKPYVERYYIDERARVPAIDFKLQSKYGGIFGLFAKTKFDTVPDPSTFTKVIG